MATGVTPQSAPLETQTNTEPHNQPPQAGIAQTPDHLEVAPGVTEGSCCCVALIQALYTTICAFFRTVGEMLCLIAPIAQAPTYSPEDLHNMGAFVTKWHDPYLKLRNQPVSNPRADLPVEDPKFTLDGEASLVFTHAKMDFSWNLYGKEITEDARSEQFWAEFMQLPASLVEQIKQARLSQYAHTAERLATEKGGTAEQHMAEAFKDFITDTPDFDTMACVKYAFAVARGQPIPASN